MKQWIRPIMGLAGAFTLLVLPAAIPAQEGQGRYVTEASVRIIRLVDAANRQGYLLKDNSLSLGGGWLKKSRDWVSLYTLKFEEGKKYRLLAAGDADSQDVDLEIQDADGKVVARDEKTDPEAVIDFAPKTTGNYVVRIRLYESRNNVPCFCIAIVMTGKNSAP